MTDLNLTMLPEQRSQLWYLASPYSKYIHGHEEAKNRVILVTAELLRCRVAVWSPIVYTHQFVAHGLPTEAKNWDFLNEPMMQACGGCIVYMMQGWQDSVGITQELGRFKEQKKPIEYMHEDENFSIAEFANYLKSSFVS